MLINLFWYLYLLLLMCCWTMISWTLGSYYLFCLSVSDLIHCTNEMNVNIPQLADSLFERTTNTSWVVVFKSLITTHHLMVYGNEVRRQNKISNLTTNYYSINVSMVDSVVMLCLTVFLLLQRFVQYLASRNTLFNLSNFLDKSGLQGSELIIIIQVHFLSLNLRNIQIRNCFFLSYLSLFFVPGYDMSTFIRRYSRYLNEKAVSYRQVAFDFTKVKRG